MGTSDQSNPRLTRRQMLKLSGSLLATAVLAACGGGTPETSAPTTAPAAAAPTSAPAAAAPTAAAAASAPTTAPAAAAPTTAPEAGAPTAAAAAPAQASGGKTKVVLMHQRNELSEDQEKQFEADNPEIEIELVEADMTRFFAMAAAGNPPDLVRVQAPDIPQLLARDLLLDLTPHFQTSSVLKIDDLAPANNYYKANSPTEIGQGKIYGMVKDWSPDFTLYAYKKAFEEASLPVPDTAKPLTYAEVGDLAKKLTKREGDRTTRWGFAYANEWIDRLMMNFLAERGKKLYSQDFTKLNLTGDDDAKAIAQYFFDLAKENLTANPLNPSPSWIGEDFTKGTVGLIQYGFWFSAMAESDVTKGNVVMLPAPTWAGKRLDPTITATGMVMSKATKVPDAAWKVFEWYNGGKIALDRFASGWGVPSLTSKYNLIPTQSDFQKQASAVLQGELQYSTTPIQFNPYLSGDVFSKVWAKHLETALRGQATFDQMLQNVESEVNAAIQDGKDKIG
jgi:multiple sugar transport system substrate-binding protein